MIWAKEETLSRADIEMIQLERLQETVRRVYGKVPAYRKKMEAAGIVPEDIRSLEDLQRLPFTTKQDMRDNYPFGLFAVPQKELCRIHASSGTTGKPTVVGYTRRDLDIWSECVARIACMGGASSGDIAQICFGYGMFTGALGLHYGLEKVGAAIVPSSTGNTKKQIMFMKDFASTLLVATPSYALRIAEVAEEIGVDVKKELKIKIGLVGSELMTEAMRQEMYKAWGDSMMLTQNYGMSELMGPGVSGECLELCGMHVNEDHFIPEIINPKTGEVLPPGEIGELVITCITKEALPLIRYRTKDLTRLMYEPCKCGRTTVRMENLLGRTDDMLKIRGVNVFPSQIEEILLNIEECGPHYEIIVGRKNHSDTLEIKVEVSADKLIDSYKALEGLERKVKDQIRTVLGLDVKVSLQSPNSLQRFEGKAKRVIDLRKEGE
ncbi:phenylacetate--CoA ligase family protein [Lactonifactor longoviformis]|uniref:Phenylacetate-coenzyme A ligase n=1 Tax=Lactonifactor longoviformis DSM 17459 TaxID=1122155 RepID=A0A1M4ZCN6_9CLOT|nr:phenylacetate--CoA ligase [Lactonifactor longoviformis]POP34104.1 phenylacetate--CoA ligase family protein [Lactonifactor longoviformis]SHF15781.1 phenylacetate-CoA ligase [Lactonifactor longoviformis DSM 17459]